MSQLGQELCGCPILRPMAGRTDFGVQIGGGHHKLLSTDHKLPQSSLSQAESGGGVNG